MPYALQMPCNCYDQYVCTQVPTCNLMCPGIHLQHVKNLWTTIVWLMIGVTFLMLGNLINDKLCLYRINNKFEIVQNQNNAVAFAEVGSFAAAGLTTMYTVTGGTNNFGEGLASAVIFFLFAQVCIQ